MDPYVIGIDLGTGSAKALAVTQTGAVVDNASVAYPTICPRPGFQEQNPELIWQAFVKCVSAITGNMKQPPAGLCLGSAMHSVIPLDTAGKPLMNMMIWADNRSAAVATRIHRSATAEMLYEQTGTPIHAMAPLSKIKWLQENQPALFQQTAKFVSIKEYIWLKLFGAYEVDYSIASATGLFDIEELTWNVNALDTAGITADQLSLPVNADHSRTCDDPSRCAELGLDKSTPVFIGASDGCLANIGSFATAEGVMALTIGSSGAVRVARKTPIHNFKNMIFNYRLDGTTFICGGATNNGGLALNWYAEKLIGKNMSTANAYALLFDDLAATAPGAEDLIFLPYLMGERAPLWNSDARGVFFGMRGIHRQAHFTRAVIEGITMALFDVARGMMENGLSVKQIHVSGGFVHSQEWLQILADIFGKKICLVNTADASAIGAGFLALKHLGLIGDFEDLKPDHVREFIPRQEFAGIYEQLFARYRAIYDRLVPLMADEPTR